MDVKKCKKIIVVVVVVVLIAFCIVPIEVGLVGGGDDDDADDDDDDDVDDDMILITSILLANFQLHMPIQCNHMVSSKGHLVVLTNFGSSEPFKTVVVLCYVTEILIIQTL